MIPRSKHVVVFILIVLAALFGLLFARTASGLRPGTAAVLESTVIETKATPAVVAPAGEDERARREAARTMMLERLQTH